MIKKPDDQVSAFLGKDTEFDGKLSFTGVVRLDGRFKGEILSEGTLIIGETALIESNIDAGNVIKSGEVRGNIAGKKKIEIHAPGKVLGNIEAPTVTIDEGAIFEGNCLMKKGKKDNKKDETIDEKIAVMPK